MVEPSKSDIENFLKEYSIMCINFWNLYRDNLSNISLHAKDANGDGFLLVDIKGVKDNLDSDKKDAQVIYYKAENPPDEIKNMKAWEKILKVIKDSHDKKDGFVLMRYMNFISFIKCEIDGDEIISKEINILE